MIIENKETKIVDQEGTELDYYGLIDSICIEPSWDYVNNRPLPVSGTEMFKREELRNAKAEDLTQAQTELLRRLANNFPWSGNNEHARQFLIDIGAQ